MPIDDRVRYQRGLQKFAKSQIRNAADQHRREIAQGLNPAAWTPYADPAMTGKITSQYKMMQDYMIPRGTDRSDEAMSELGTEVADKLMGVSDGLPSQQQQVQATRDLIPFADMLNRIGKKRQQDFLPEEVRKYLGMFKKQGGD